MHRPLVLVIGIFFFLTLPTTKGNVTLNALAQNYTQLQNANITYDAITISELGSHALQDYAKRNIVVEPKWQLHISFSADKNGFIMEADRLGAGKDFNSFSYDGTTYAMLRRPPNILTVSKKPATLPAEFWNSDPMLLPVAILAKSQNTANQLDCMWRDAITPSFWAGLPITISLSDQEHLPLKDELIVVTTSNTSPIGITGFEIHKGKPDVLWRKYICSEFGQLDFTENGQKKVFFYPKRSTYQMYDDLGNLTRTDTHEITKVIINNPAFDESMFVADPGSVTRIYDSDSSKWIDVPK